MGCGQLVALRVPTAGLLVDLILRAVGISFPHRTAQVVMTGFSWNYTTWLNIVFLGIGALVHWTYRNRERLGGGGQYAKDPVCGMQVERANPGAPTSHDGQTVYFCSDRCADKFAGDPSRYAGSAGAARARSVPGFARAQPAP